MNKRERHQTIREIVNQGNIQTQTELVKELRKRGFKVTQATVSRDIAEIPLQKQRTFDGRWVYMLQGPSLERPVEKMMRIVREFVVGVRVSENLVLLKTTAGAAQTVASSIDEANLENVLGTVAGDDTILVVTSGKDRGKKVYQLFLSS